MRKSTAIATIFYLIASALIPYMIGIMFPAGVATGWVYQLCFFPAFLACAFFFFVFHNAMRE